LIAALISVALIAGARAIGQGLDDKFTAVSSAIDGQTIFTGTAQ